MNITHLNIYNYFLFATNDLLYCIALNNRNCLIAFLRVEHLEKTLRLFRFLLVTR